ncbi:MAG: DUF559 domain-containing protein [Roseibium sp.]
MKSIPHVAEIRVSEVSASVEYKRKLRTLRLASVSPLEGEMSARADRGGYTTNHWHADLPVPTGTKAMPHKDVTENLRSNAKKLRSGMTDAEKKLWQVIRAHRLDGIAFRRQMPISGYIVDFAAPEHRLIVELDGSQHGELQGLLSDKKREERLASLGWKIVRFWNADVNDDLDGVCRKILSACGKEIF